MLSRVGIEATHHRDVRPLYASRGLGITVSGVLVQGKSPVVHLDRDLPLVAALNRFALALMLDLASRGRGAVLADHENIEEREQTAQPAARAVESTSGGAFGAVSEPSLRGTVLRLQATAGNRATARWVSRQRMLQREVGWWAEKAAGVRSAIRHERNFVGYPDGAFWIINPLNDEDRATIMKHLDRSDLDELIAHGDEAEAAGVPNAKDIVAKATRARNGSRPGPQLGWWDQNVAAVHVAIRQAHNFVGYPDGAFWIINALNEQDRAKMMNLIDRGDLEQLIEHGGEAEKAGVPNARDIVDKATAARAASGPGKSTWWGQKVAAVRAAIRDEKNFVGYPNGAFWIINPLNEQDRAKVMTLLDREDLDALSAHWEEADQARVPNGNDIVTKANDELRRRGFTPTARQEVYELEGGTGDDAPGVSPNPRLSSRYIDNRVTAVYYGIWIGAATPGVGPGAFLLDIEGFGYPVLVPWRYTTLSTAAASPSEDTVFATRDAALSAILAKGQQLESAYAYYDVVAGMIAPTTFSLSSAPRTMNAARDAFSRYTDEVTYELTVLAISLATLGILNAFMRVGSKIFAKAVKPSVKPTDVSEAMPPGMPPPRPAAGEGPGKGPTAGPPAKPPQTPDVEPRPPKPAPEVEEAPPTPRLVSDQEVTISLLEPMPKGPATEYGRSLGTRLKAEGKTGPACLKPIAEDLNAKSDMTPADKAYAAKVAVDTSSLPTFGTGPVVEIKGHYVVTSRQPMPNAPVRVVTPEGRVVGGNVDISWGPEGPASGIWTLKNLRIKP